MKTSCNLSMGASDFACLVWSDVPRSCTLLYRSNRITLAPTSSCVPRNAQIRLYVRISDGCPVARSGGGGSRTSDAHVISLVAHTAGAYKLKAANGERARESEEYAKSIAVVKIKYVDTHNLRVFAGGNWDIRSGLAFWYLSKYMPSLVSNCFMVGLGTSYRKRTWGICSPMRSSV